MFAEEVQGISSDTNDEELLAASRRADRGAYGELWARHYPIAVSIANRVGAADAEDIVSEAFASIWAQLQENSGPAGNFRAYLLATVRNLCAKAHRKLARVSTGVEIDLEDTRDRTLEVEHEETMRDIRLAFAKLPERWRTVLWLSEVEARSRTEVAATLELSPNSTTQLLRRAKEGLREAWLSERFAPEPNPEHKKFVSDLPRYVRGGGTSRRRVQLRDHIVTCARCEARVAELKHENIVLGAALALLPLVGGVVGIATHAPGAAATGTAMAHIQARALETQFVIAGKLGGHTVWLLPIAAVAGAALVLPMLMPVPVNAKGENPALPNGESEAVQEHSEGASDAPEENGTADADPASDAGQQHDQSGLSAEKPNSVQAPPTVGAGNSVVWPFHAGLVGANPFGVAPFIGGSAEPGLPVIVTVSGALREVSVASDGTWAIDLGGLGLNAGTHSARVQQGDRQLPAVSFSLELPYLESVPGGSTPSGRQLRVAGSAGATVCIQPVGQDIVRLLLDSSGVALTGLDGSQTVRFYYCDGARRGPEGSFAG